MLGDKSPGVACGLELVGQSDQAIIRRALPQSRDLHLLRLCSPRLRTIFKEIE